jgi:hypothetical protein
MRADDVEKKIQLERSREERKGEKISLNGWTQKDQKDQRQSSQPWSIHATQDAKDTGRKRIAMAASNIEFQDAAMPSHEQNWTRTSEPIHRDNHSFANRWT